MTITDTNSQPAPKPNDRPAAWGLVMQDMSERDAFGTAHGCNRSMAVTRWSMPTKKRLILWFTCARRFMSGTISRPCPHRSANKTSYQAAL